MFRTSIHDRDPHDQVNSAVLGVFYLHVMYENQGREAKHLPWYHISSNTMDRRSS
jgi:hypothetical protein